MKAHTVRWVQETRQEASKYGCNIKTRDENHQENYRYIKCLYVEREKGKTKWHRGSHQMSAQGYILQHVWNTQGLSQFTQGSNKGILNIR